MGLRHERKQSRALKLAAAVVAVQTASAQPAAGASVPPPAVSLPPNGVRGFPHLSEVLDLAARGYVEEEFFIAGTARAYVPQRPLTEIADGRWDAAPTGPTAPFRTRLIIRRPADPVRFNGTVLLDWMNVSSGFDVDAFGRIADEFMREGYVYVGISAQKVGVAFLRDKWESGPGARYAALSHPGDSFSYDIFSQAAKALRAPAPTGPAPLGELTGRVRAIVAAGGSQSGARLITYINAVHPTAGVIDGFMPSVASNGSALTQAPLAEVRVPAGAASKIRTDGKGPVLFINSETELMPSANGLHAQPDGARFRLWELTGVAHGTRPTLGAFAPKAQKSELPYGLPPCANPPMNDVDNAVATSAGLHAMRQWIERGRAPRSAPRAAMSVASDPAVAPRIERDPATGIARGGLRLPDVAVPMRTITGTRPAGEQDGSFCRLFGSVDPWNGDSDPFDGKPGVDPSSTPEPSLARLYGSKARYVEAVRVSAKQLVEQGFLRPADAAIIVANAEAVTFP